jgi:hypothetical protein
MQDRLARAMLCSDINAGFQERSHNPLATRFALPMQRGHSIEAFMIILVVMTKVSGTAPGIVVAAFLFMFNTFFAVR